MMPEENSMYPVESGICKNLRYSLEQLKIGGDKETYMNLVDSVLVGPESVKQADLEDILGVNSDIYRRSMKKRKELIDGGFKPSWKTEERSHMISQPNIHHGRPQLPSERSPRLGRRSEYQMSRKRKNGGSWKSTDLHFQFELFSKFGDSSSDGSQITLSQSDKWLRQANVIDGWTISTTDTAIAFRKISRGSIWLEYNPWREFLEELCERKGLDMQDVVLKLERSGKPSHNATTKFTANPTNLL